MIELNIALVQSKQYWHDPERNRNHFGEQIGTLKDIDLIVLPEMFSTGFTMASNEVAETMDGPTIGWLQQQARQLNACICGSLVVKEKSEFFNRFFLVRPGGDVESYNKRHLFRMAKENDAYSSGKQRKIFDVKGVRICPQVCYDLRFPVFSRNQSDYDLLLFVANWPAARQQHWRTLLTARAIENQSFVIGVNRVGSDGNGIQYCGDSGFIDANGDWLVDMKDASTVELIKLKLEDLQQYRELFPAWRDADEFNLVER